MGTAETLYLKNKDSLLGSLCLDAFLVSAGGPVFLHAFGMALRAAVDMPLRPGGRLRPLGLEKFGTVSH